MRISDKIAGQQAPADLDNRGKTFAELANELTDKDVDMRIELTMRTKSAELEHLRTEASLTAYSQRVVDCIDSTFKELVEMDLQSDW